MPLLRQHGQGCARNGDGMNDQKPKDCTCGFPKVRHTDTFGHAEWCPAYKRLLERANRRWDLYMQDATRHRPRYDSED
jgi:hypothetical protein